MKKIFFLSIIASLLLIISCNPNEELYKEHDEAIDNSYNEKIDYILTDNDYSTISGWALANSLTSEDSTIAKAIDTYSAFAFDSMVAVYVPDLLSQTFIALDSSSVVRLQYDFDYSLILDNEKKYTLKNVDYTTIGGAVADSVFFWADELPEDHIPDFLLDKFPDAENEDFFVVKYKYKENNSVSFIRGFYLFSEGEWNINRSAYILVDEDYEFMGEPGDEHKFSDDYPPGDYLPTFMTIKYPYANPEDEKIIIYDYSGASTAVHYTKYFYDGVAWNNFEQKDNQFIHDGSEWQFDPTVKLFITATDFQLIVNYVNDNIGSEYVSSYGNNDFYTGASAYYSNFDLRIVKRRENIPQDFPESMSDEDALALAWERLYEGLEMLLMVKYPDAVPVLGGLDVHYFLSFDVFNDDYAHIYYTVEYKCTGSGNPPTFEMVTEATVIE